jgi:3-oxoacyl-[acyl-carrier-protein] synthase III
VPSPSVATLTRAARDRPALPGRAGIAALGLALPDRTVGTAEIAARLGVEPGWIITRTGVHERRRASAEESLTALAADAGSQALTRAGLEAGALDLVLVATLTPDDLLPNAAPLVADRLGADRAGAIDVGAACSGFLSGLALGAGVIDAHRAENVLLVGADLMSRVVDPDDRPTAALFGDGAGAAVLTADGSGRVGPVVMRSDGSLGALVAAAHADRRLRMRGQDTFRVAVTQLVASTHDALASAGLELDDVDLFVYHQANARIIAAVGSRLGVEPERVVDCISSYGNTSAASVPIALCVAESEGRLAAGDRVLVGAFGAGLTWGAAVVQWGER